MKIHAPTFRCGMHAVLLGLFVTLAAQGAEETRDFKTLLAKWLPDKIDLEINSSDLLRLTPEQKAELAVAAAQELSLRTTNGVFITQELYEASQNSSTSKTAASQSVRAQIAINSSRFRIIDRLIHDGRVYDARLIPPMIKMLGSPNYSEHLATGYLERLTGRSVEFPYRPSEEAEQCGQVAEWWRAWWGKNQYRHPVLDPALKAQLSKRLDQMVDQLTEDLGEHIALSQLKPFSRDSYRIGSSEMDAGTGVHQPPLVIVMDARFGTPFPEGAFRDDEILNYPGSDTFAGDFERKHGRMVECLREEVAGTDITLTVRAGTPDKDYLRRLRESLTRVPKANWSK